MGYLLSKRTTYMLTTITELTLKSQFPHLDDDDLVLIGEVIDTALDRKAAKDIIARQRTEFVSYDGATPISDFLVDRYHEAYQNGWKHLYHSPTGMNGKVSGDWWEDFNKAVLRAALYKANISDFSVGTKRTQEEDHDNYAGSSSDDIWISQECKLQSDKASLKKALDSYNQNKAFSQHCYISFATNNAFTSNKGKTAKAVMVEKGILPKVADDVVSAIIQQKCGSFVVNENLTIVIFGYDKPEYVSWRGKKMDNHGGKKGWTLSSDAVDAIVDSLAETLENITTK